LKEKDNRRDKEKSDLAMMNKSDKENSQNARTKYFGELYL